jgi:uncharacterized Zn ribbon protein
MYHLSIIYSWKGEVPMKTLKRMLVTLVAMAMMVAGFSTLAFAAASPSVTSIKKATVSLSTTKLTYTGENQSPKVTVTYAGEKLKEGTDYTVSVEKTKAVGTGYKVTITGMGLFEGSVNKTYQINQASLSKATATAEAVVYNGKEQTAVLTVTDANGNTLKQGTDYTVKNATSTKAGTVSVTITGKGNYKGTTKASFKIGKASITKATVDVTNVVYNGKAQTAALTVTDANGNTLEQGKDYTVKNAKKTNAGTYTVTITGKNNYMGTQDVSFKIGKANVSKLNVTVKDATYTGKAQTAKVTVTTAAGKKLTANKDYTVEKVTKTNAGTYTVTITGKGNYMNTQDVSFKIGKANVSKLNVTVKDATYTGKAQTAKVTVTTAAGKKLTANKDYTVEKVTKTKAGTYTVTITGKGNYFDSTEVDFTIAKATQTVKATVSSKTTVTVKASDLKKKAKTYTLKVKGAKGTVTYETSSSKYIAVKNGKISVAKNTPKGTYKITVKVAGTDNYKAATKQVVTITVK